jgi:adenine/guanine phosphoribosyltransferase-like PRPP-binding protein
MRTRGFPAGMAPPLFLFRDDAPLKAHPAYRAAKAGDADPAAHLVMDLARPLADQARTIFGPDVIYVAPHAVEASGENAIPQTLARATANAADGVTDTDIVQATRVFHTGANRMERLNSRAEFDGPVQRGSHYVLVDDVTTIGGTLAELADYIQPGCGFVEGVAVIVNASRSDRIGSESRGIPRLRRILGIPRAGLADAYAQKALTGWAMKSGK